MADKNNRIRRNSLSKRSSSSNRTSLRMGAATNTRRQNPNLKRIESQNNSGEKKRRRVSKAYYKDSRQPYEKKSSSSHSERNTSHSRNPSRKKKKKYLRKSSGNGAKKFASAIFVIILAYVSTVAYKFLTRPSIPYDSVIYGNIDTVKTVTGIIVRDEKIYNSPSKGTLSFNIADFERVKKGEIICSVKDEELVGSMEEELKGINKNILEIQDTRDDLSAFSEDIKRIDYQIKDIVDENVFELSTGNINKIYFIKENVKKKMDSKNQMLLSESGGSLQELADKKIERENEINKNTASVSALESGILSYGFDGLEASLNFEGLNKMTEEQTLMKQDDNSIQQAAGVVNENDGVFKIVSSNVWYIAAYIENSDIDGWEKDDYKTIYIKNNGENIPIEAQIYTISQSESKTYVVFKITKNILDYINSRSISFEINKAQEGLKINSNAIVEAHTLKIPSGFVSEDGSVIKKSSDSTVNIAVSVSGTDETGQYVYIPVDDRLDAQDEIVNPENPEDTYKITEISTAKGVYVINTGVTAFKSINLENSIHNSTHTILDPNLNTNIKVYDRIVTDIKNIGEEEKIF